MVRSLLTSSHLQIPTAGIILFMAGGSIAIIAKLKKDFTAIVPFKDGTTFKEITPSGYVEGPMMFKRDGKYYFV